MLVLLDVILNDPTLLTLSDVTGTVILLSSIITADAVISGPPVHSNDEYVMLWSFRNNTSADVPILNPENRNNVLIVLEINSK